MTSAGGHHLLLDLEGCDSATLDSKSAMLGLCHDVARLLGARVLKRGAHQFSPHGVTAFVVIAESHISIHTWPEVGKAYMDVFTCTPTLDTEQILDLVLGSLGTKRGWATLVARDSERGRVVSSGALPGFRLRLDFGHSIYRTRSPFQRIELTRGPLGVSLFLDGYWQFVEAYEHIYHEVLVHPAMVCAAKLDRVGIGGGGDALALREVLRHRGLGMAEMHEIDAKMLHLARTHPELIRLNKRAPEHPRARVVAGDATRMLREKAFDVLIFDFPSLSESGKFDPLYGARMYERARRALAPGGVLVTQITDFARNLRRTEANLRRVFPHVQPLHVLLDRSVFSFIMASERPIRQRRPLPPGLRFLTQSRLDRILSTGRVTHATPRHVVAA